MCGIFGIVSSNKAPDKSLLSKGVELVHHRGPDAKGVFQINNIGLAHARLAIIDISDNGIQPMEAYGLRIVYNGVVYNYLELKATLIEEGYFFRTETDTEVILAAYKKWGSNCVSHFNGMWAFAIYDENKKELFCSRDRFGIKPFHYILNSTEFVFASEIKQFSALSEWKASLNQQLTFEFMKDGLLDHRCETFFAEVKKLEPGSNLLFNMENFDFKTWKYYDLRDIRPIQNIGLEESIAEIRSSLDQLIKLQLRADVNIGISLSGGLDSSTIACLAARETQKPVRSVSSYFDVHGYRELHHAKAVVNKISGDGIYFQPDIDNVFAQLEKLVWHQDEPFLSMSNFSQFKVFSKAHEEGLKVMLGGQGGDEVFAGYHKFFFLLIKNLMIKKPIEAFGQFLRYNYKNDFKFPLPAQRITRYFIPEIKKNHHGVFRNNFLQNVEQYHRPGENTMFEASINYFYSMGLPKILRSEDRNSMAFSIESRVPLLDHKLVEFVLALPEEFKIKNGVLKYLLRESMKDQLPEQVYLRNDKLGYPTPQKEWILKNQGVFNKELENVYPFIEKIINESILKTSNIDLKWRALILAKWIKVFNVQV